MKKLLLSATLLLSVATFAQKDELKVLKKIYAKETISDKDLQEYKTASDALQSLATEESDKVYAKFYKTMYPTIVLASKGAKATMQDQMNLYKPEFIKEYGEVINETLDFEKKSGKKIYTDELIQEKGDFKKELSAIAMNLNNTSKFKEASALFYSLYTFDPKEEGKSLKNACILAVQAEDYKLAQKLYEEYAASDYLNNGITFYAINKANGSEEEFNSRADRTQYISLGSHEKPKDVKNSTKKADVLKLLALIYSQNSELEKAKSTYSEARILAPNDEELKKGEFQIYYNSGYAMLADEDKIVNEINSSRDNPKKYDELVKKRKDMFLKALPDFEKAYSIDSSNVNLKNILKMSYEITGQPEKAKAIN
ncbi:hypothetical protein [Flavobacterium sp.]|uniref:hypothetical protein n=1 Tax=Flavobacterium sp. TaxID=239 RepID=UPI0008C2586F|nr:hypothetical protein [Flavobacterium sp.]OGS61389.1 MAG: hypothetical protein A2X07_08385 [Flavobacteria bacterium GWF1_32_7]HBD25567.1 hypothetical protein [Flavobacterium sp.]